MSSPTYLDTSALIRRAESAVSSPTRRNAHAGVPVATLLGTAGGPVATSDVGLLEFHDVITLLWRDTAIQNSQYDEPWAAASISKTMDDIDEDRLIILNTPAKAYEQAMTLVTMTTSDYGQRFRVWDAVHLVAATVWAETLGEQVEIWTTDTDFQGFLELYPYFGASVSVRNLDD